MLPELNRERILHFEWPLMRACFALCCIYHSSHHKFVPGSGFSDTYGLQVDAQPVPVGLAQFFDLTWAASPGFAAFAPFLFYAALALYVAGRFMRVTTALLLAFLTVYGTLENSQGAIHHTAQIIGYALFGQLLYFLFLKKDDTPREGLPGPAAATVQAVAAAYVVSGFSKLVRSGTGWITDIPNIALQLEKNRLAEYYNTLVQPPEAASSLAVNLVTNTPLLGQVFFGAGLFLELTAFLALLGRTWALAWGAGLWGLHIGISEMMHLGFFYNKAILGIFFINFPFWALLLAARLSSLKGRDAWK